MKKMLIILVALGLMLGVAYGQMGGQMMGGQEMMQQNQAQTTTGQMPYQMGPATGYGYGMGSGMMMGPGMGYGMMGGYGMGPGMMGYGAYPGFGYGMMGCTAPGMMMAPGMMGMMHNMMMGGGYGMGYGMGPRMMGYGYSKEFQKFLDETRQLRRLLNEKRFDYFEALRNPETKPETITKLRKEILDLKNKIYEKAPWKGFGGCGY